VDKSVHANAVCHGHEQCQQGDCTFLDHCKPDRLALDGWKDLLDKHINNMPSGFTKNYLFEFIDGKVCIKPLVTAPDAYQATGDIAR
jgi:hypothetical protein